MTVKEALSHDWQIGEKIWEVYYKYNKDITTCNGMFMTEQPAGIIEVEVTNIERSNPRHKDDWENINITLKGDFGCDWRDVPHKNTIITAMVTHNNYDGTIYDRYDHLKFCTDKFFNKKDAEKRLKKAVEQWNKKVKTFQESQKNKIDEAKKKYEELLKNGLINIEDNLIKN